MPKARADEWIEAEPDAEEPSHSEVAAATPPPLSQLPIAEHVEPSMLPITEGSMLPAVEPPPALFRPPAMPTATPAMVSLTPPLASLTRDESPAHTAGPATIDLPVPALAPAHLRPAGEQETSPSKSPRGIFIALAAVVLICGGLWLSRSRPANDRRSAEVKMGVEARTNEPAALPETKPAPAQEVPAATLGTAVPSATPPPTESPTAAPEEKAEEPKPAPSSESTEEHATPTAPKREPRVATAAATTAVRPSSQATADGEDSAEGPTSKPKKQSRSDAIQVALAEAAQKAKGCRDSGSPTGVARVAVTFAPSGEVAGAAVLGPPFANTLEGACIVAKFRALHLDPFPGDSVTVQQSVVLQ